MGTEDVREAMLEVPGARLCYEIRGSGPVLLLLGAPMGRRGFAAIAPLALLALVLVAPLVLRRGPAARLSSGRLAQLLAQSRRAMTRVRAGLSVFRDPKLGATAVIGQLAAWALQWVSCYTLMIALGLNRQVGVGAAAAVLFPMSNTAPPGPSAALAFPRGAGVAAPAAARSSAGGT